MNKTSQSLEGMEFIMKGALTMNKTSQSLKGMEFIMKGALTMNNLSQSLKGMENFQFRYILSFSSLYVNGKSTYIIPFSHSLSIFTA